MNFYQKQRIKEDKLDIRFEPVICEDIGLYVIGKYPRLEFGHLNFSEDLDWNRNAYDTIKLTILNLINNEVIEVVKVLDYRTYCFKLFRSYDTSYCFKVTDLQVDKDWFSLLVFKTINEVNRSKYPNLRKYIDEIIDKLLYNGNNYSSPSRSLLIRLFHTYAKKFKWIELNKTKKLLGLVDDFSLKVEGIYIPRISMQHKTLTDIDNNLLRGNKDYKDFCRTLKSEIDKSFSRKNNDNN